MDILGYHRFAVLRYGGHTQPVTATTEVNSELYENSATTKLEETLKKFKTAALAATYPSFPTFVNDPTFVNQKMGFLGLLNTFFGSNS